VNIYFFSRKFFTDFGKVFGHLFPPGACAFNAGSLQNRDTQKTIELRSSTPILQGAMYKQSHPDMIDDKTSEPNDAWFARAKPAAEILPTELRTVLPKRKPGQRGKQKAPVKVPTTIRFDADVLEKMKATGKGWQTRINDLTRAWLEQQRTN
jgi:uncharacterized protein (DUF4415 family)